MLGGKLAPGGGTLPSQGRLPEEDIARLESLKLIQSFPGKYGGHAGQGKQCGQARGGQEGICCVEEA